MADQKLRDELESSDRTYVKASHLDCYDEPRVAGRALREALEEGWVEVWSDASQQYTYRVLL